MKTRNRSQAMAARKGLLDACATSQDVGSDHDSETVVSADNPVGTATGGFTMAAKTNLTDSAVTAETEAEVFSTEPILAVFGTDGIPTGFLKVEIVGTTADGNDVVDYVPCDAPDGKNLRFLRDGFGVFVSEQRGVRKINDQAVYYGKEIAKTRKNIEALAKIKNADMSAPIAALESVVAGYVAALAALQGDDSTATDPTDESGVEVIAS